MPYSCTTPAVLQGKGGPWDGLNMSQQCSLSVAPPNEAAAAAAAAQQLLQGEGCSPHSTQEAISALPCPVWALPIQDTNISKQVQSTASARAEGTSTPGERQVRSTVTAVKEQRPVASREILMT